MRYIVFILPVAMICLGSWILLQYFQTGSTRELLFGIGGLVYGLFSLWRRMKTRPRN